jgi:hypothetical protein
MLTDQMRVGESNHVNNVIFDVDNAYVSAQLGVKLVYSRGF